ncbi:MAG: mannitol dehydrogenase family protein, partial [Ignavibacteriae bacterium]|nr:mannitol dehydrogenase family protein [Ignavibacteriota bacterium]
AGKLILLSCDNIQGNGDVLKIALLTFLNAYDETLVPYVKEQIDFPNSMVDRITPTTTEIDKIDFEYKYGYNDKCLVICEDFLQWIIEKDESVDFPPLESVGVVFTDDVKPYEEMKLRVLNGGHSLVGLLGSALNYNYIHEAVKNEQISKLFDYYMDYDVIPSLSKISNVDYRAYVYQVKNRFGNKLIKDSVDRIISFSSSKIPKFVLPVINNSLSSNKISIGSMLILAAWWHYLNELIAKQQFGKIQDINRDAWISVFSSGNSVEAFLNRQDIFGDIGNNIQVVNQVKKLVNMINSKGMVATCNYVLKTVQN